ASMTLSPLAASTWVLEASASMKIIFGMKKFPVERSGGLQSQGQMLETAQHVVDAAHGLPFEADFAHALGDRRQDALAFQARDHLADAHVNTVAQGDVPQAGTRNVVVVGAVPEIGIAVG